MTKLHVLHIDSSVLWGGGQSQISTLIRESGHLPIEHHLASPRNSKLWFKIRSQISGFLPLSRSGVINPFAMLRARNYCVRHGIQIIHAHCGKSHTFAYWLKRFFLHDIVLVVHRRIPAKIRPNFVSRKKFTDKIVNQFICVSDYIRGVLLSGGVSTERAITIRSSKKSFPSDATEKSRARDSLEHTRGLNPGGNFFIVSASRLVPDKGLFILIEAFRRLLRDRPQARLLIAGEGPLEQELKLTAKSIIESGHVVFLGFRDDIPQLLLGADVFAIPSLSEGLGSTIVEAMIARTAVVGSAVEGIPELIRHQSTGILVPPGQPGALYEALLLLSDNHQLRHTLADNALRWADGACTPRSMVEGTYAAYLNAIKAHDPKI